MCEFKAYSSNCLVIKEQSSLIQDGLGTENTFVLALLWHNEDCHTVQIYT